MEAKDTKDTKERCKNSEKVTECSLCDRKFKSKDSLHYHMMVHKDLRPCQCSLCDSKFRTNQQRKRHELSVHRDLNSRKESLQVEKDSEIRDCYKAVTPDHVNHTNKEDEDETTSSTIDDDLSQKAYHRKRSLSNHSRSKNAVKKKQYPSATNNSSSSSFDQQCDNLLQPQESESSSSSPEEISSGDKMQNNSSNSLQFGSSVDCSEDNFENANSTVTSKNSKYPSIQTSLNQTTQTLQVKKIDQVPNRKKYDSGIKPWTKCFEYNPSENVQTWTDTNSSKPKFKLTGSLPRKIQCHHCEDEFFEPHYFDLHLKHWHKDVFNLENK